MSTEFLAKTFPNVDLTKPCYRHSLALEKTVGVYETIAVAAAQGTTLDDILVMTVTEDAHKFLIDQILANGVHLEHIRFEDDRYFYQSNPQTIAAYLNDLPAFNQL